jgi:Zn-dependent protease
MLDSIYKSSQNFITTCFSAGQILDGRFLMSGKESVTALRKLRVRLHYSWIAIFIFMTAAVITQFSTSYPFLQRLALGLVASSIFLITIIIRAYIIALLALRRAAIIKSQTIFAVGVVLDIDKTSTFPAMELLLAITGVLINLVLAGTFFTVYEVLAQTGSIMVYVFVQWLAFIYFMLSIFDLLPGLPLDGGRILWTVLWKATGKFEKMMRILSWTGWALGMAFLVTGIVLTIVSRQWFVGVLLALPGLILQNASTHERHRLGTSSPGDKSEGPAVASVSGGA